MNAGLAFGFVQQGIGSYNKEKYPKWVDVLSKKTARVAGFLGSLGAVFALIMAFIPQGESAELKFMKDEFAKLFTKVDAIARSVEDTKNLIESSTQQAAYVRYENNIHNGYTALDQCLKQLENVHCSNKTDCYRQKVSVAEGYISRLNVRQDMDAIFRGVTSDSSFGRSLLVLLKEKSKCDVPQINNLANKVISLMTKALTVSIFHDYWTKTDYNVLDETASIESMFRLLENKRQSLQDVCFKHIDNRLATDIMETTSDFSSDTQFCNTILLRKLRKKLSWIDFYVFCYSGDHVPIAGPSDSIRRHYQATSKQQKIHAFVIPTNNNSVENLNVKIEQWKELTQQIKKDSSVAHIENLIKGNAILESQVQSFSIMRGSQWVLGYYNDTVITQNTLGTYNVNHLNVFVNRPHLTEPFLVVVSFIQTDYSFNCSESNSCNGNGVCLYHKHGMHLQIWI